MKKLVILFFALTVFIVTANAQRDSAKIAARELQKQKEIENVQLALKDAGVPDSVAIIFQEVQIEYAAKNNVVRFDSTLSNAEKLEKFKTITAEKNARLIELLGADKYRGYNKARKLQKQSEASAVKQN